MSEIKACPFCKASLKKRVDWDMYDHEINGCILEGCTIAEKAIGEWNTRHGEKAVLDEVIRRIKNRNIQQGYKEVFISILEEEIEAMKEER